MCCWCDVFNVGVFVGIVSVDGSLFDLLVCLSVLPVNYVGVIVGDVIALFSNTLFLIVVNWVLKTIHITIESFTETYNDEQLFNTFK